MDSPDHFGTSRRLLPYEIKSHDRRGENSMEAAFAQKSSPMPAPQPTGSHVTEVLSAAHEELKQLIDERSRIMKRIGTIKQTISGLANIFGDEILTDELMELVDRKTPSRQPGFTKVCRMVLMEAAAPIGAREVCERIQRKNPPVLLRHKDPLASVTTVLNRLVEYGEARSVVRENGRRAWQWVADPTTSGFENLPRSDR